MVTRAFGSLRLGAGTRQREDAGLQALIMAQQGDANGLRAALTARADVNTRSRAGSTPLITAASYGHQEVVRLLLERRANVNLSTSRGNTALLVSLLGNH